MDPEVEVILNLLVNVGMDAADIAKLRKTVQDTLDSIVKGMQAKVGAAAGKQAGTAAVGQMRSVNKLLLQEHKAYLAEKARLDAKAIADDLKRQGRQDTAQRQATARANAHADRLDAASNTKHRQTMQTRIDNNRAGQHRMTQDNGAEASKRLVSARSADAYLLNEQRSANARLLAADQQHGARRTALYRTVLNNLTRANQTGMTLIVNAWRSHQAKVLETQRTGNRREESELNASLSRRQARLQANLAKQNAIAARGSTGDRTQAILGGSVAGKAIGRGVLGLGGLFAGGVGARKVFDILSEYQGIETAFKGLFDEVKGGAPRTTAFLKDMQEFAKVTPFSLKQVATSAQKLFTTRVINIDSKHAQAELKDWLEALSNAASATGKGGEEMDRALLGITQIGGAGRLKTQDLRQITENIGLPLEEVAKALGLTTAELFDALKKGSIDSKTGLAAVLKALKNIPGAAGAAERQSKTLAGAWSTLKDTGEQLVVRLLMPAGKAFAALTVSFATLVGQFLDGKGAWKVLRDGLMGIVVAMGAIFAAKGAVTVVKLLGVALSAVAAAPVISGLVALSAVLATFPGISKILGGLVEGTKNWFLVGYRANAVIDGLGPVAKIASTLGKAARFIQSFSTALIVGSKDWFLVGYRIKGVITDFSNIVKLQSGIGAAARVIKDGLVDIGRAFGLLFQDHDTEAFKKNIGKAIDGMSKGLGPIRDLLVKEMRLGVTNLNKFILEKLPEVGKFISQNIAKIAPPAAAVGGGLLFRLLGLGGGGIKGRLLKLGIGSLIGAAVTYGIKEFDTAPATASLGERLSVIFENAAARAKEWKLNIGDFLSGLFTQNKDLGDAGQFGRSIREFISKALSDTTGMASTIASFFGRLGNDFFSVFDSGVVAKWVIDLPRKIGKALSRAVFSEEFLKFVAGLGAVVVAGAIVIAGQFIRGFTEGLWSRRGDIAKTLTDIFVRLPFALIGGTLGGQIASAAMLAFAARFVVSKLLTPLGKIGQRVEIGAKAGNFADARVGLKDMNKEIDKSGSKAANFGVSLSAAAARGTEGFAKLRDLAISTGGRIESVGVKMNGTGAQGLAGTGALREAARRLGDVSPIFGKVVEKLGTGVRQAGNYMTLLGRSVRSGADLFQKGWKKIGGAAGATQAAVGIATGAITGYFAGMADSSAAKVTTLLGAAAGIATAFAVGGPVLGPVLAGLTAVSTLIGYAFGTAEKKSKQAAEKIKTRAEEISAATKAYAKSFEDVFKQSGSSGGGARAAAVLDALKSTSDDLGVTFDDLTKKFGISMDELASSAEVGSRGLLNLKDQVIKSSMGKVFDGNTVAIKRFGRELKSAIPSQSDFLSKGIFGSDPGNQGAKRAQDQAKSAGLMFKNFSLGLIKVDALREGLVRLGYTAQNADKLIAQFASTFEGSLRDSSGAKFLEAAGPAIDAAIRNYNAQKTLADEAARRMENLLPGADRFAAAYDRISAALDKAKDAYRRYTDALFGKQRDADTVTQELFSTIRQRLEPKAEGEQAPEFAARQRNLLKDEVDALAPQIARLAKESGGDVETLRGKVNDYIQGLINDTTDPAFKQALADLIPQIPEDALRNALGTQEDIKTLGNLKNAYSTFLTDVDNKPLAIKIKTTDFQARYAAIVESLEKLRKSDPAVNAYLVKGDNYEETVQAIFNDSVLIGALAPTVTVTIRARFDKTLEDLLGSLGPGFLNLTGVGKPKQNWNGGLETSPTLSTLAERGPEAIFPLTNPRRMRQILAMPPVAQAFAGIGVAAPSFGSPDSGAPVHGNIDQSMTNTYNIEASDPQATADEIFRRQRAAKFLGGHTLVRPRR